MNRFARVWLGPLLALGGATAVVFFSAFLFDWWHYGPHDHAMGPLALLFNYDLGTLQNALGNLAQIYGYVLEPKCSSERRTDLLHSAYLFPEEDRPKYLLGFGVIAGMCAFGVMVYALAHVLFRRHIR